MRLLCLNIWGGRIFEPLMRFVAEQARGTDVFCFQEVFDTSSNRRERQNVRTNIFQELSTVLSGFDSFFAPIVEGSDFEGTVDFPLRYGLATFVRQSLSARDHAHALVYPGRESAGRGHPRIVQRVRLTDGSADFAFYNFHGLVLDVPDRKKDSPERIEQSRKVKKFLGGTGDRTVLCGDFNLRPDTESLSMLVKGMVNLIQPDHVATTRSSLYTGSEKFSDYILVSPDVRVSNVEVLADVVSDHLSLALEFSA